MTLKWSIDIETGITQGGKDLRMDASRRGGMLQHFHVFLTLLIRLSLLGSELSHVTEEVSMLGRYRNEERHKTPKLRGGSERDGAREHPAQGE